MNYKPFPYQQRAIDEINEKFKTRDKVLLQAHTGFGKCLAKDTPILMYDGTIKKVQDIVVGDKIMGDDSSERNVLSLSRGRETMYEITPVKGDSFTVNESHILSLKMTGVKSGYTYNGKKYFKGDVIDISVKDYLNQKDYFKHIFKQYRVGVDFNKENKLPLDSYYLGLWLGDGTSNSASITTMDNEVIDFLNEYIHNTGENSRIEYQKDNRSIVYHITNKYKRGGTLTKLRELDLIKNKHIPLLYKTSSRDERLSLLAGILDSDGYLNKGSSFDAIFKLEVLANDVAYLARSLGFASYVKECKKGCFYKGEYKEGIYYRVCINGDCSIIPTKIHRNKASKRQQNKDVLVTGFSVKKLEEDNYYGFEIDGNRRFLLGDFTVTHNTVVFSNLAKQYVSNGSKVLILCHRSELVDQTMKTLISLGLTCQSIVPSTKRIHYMADVYVAMIETINNRLKKGKFDIPEIDLVVADECHILIFDKVYKYFPNAKILGCTATPVVLKKTRYFECRLCKCTYNENTTCCNEETMEWTKPFTMSSIYDDIVVGAPISELIDFGQLVPEISFVRNVADLKDLKVDSSGDYTTKSLDESFGSDDAVFNVLLNYEELCKGKRTIIFNSSTKTNLKVYEQFRDKGYNVKMFDSVNDSGISRKDLVKWFNENDDAILCNVSVFTTGFDSKEVEAIIINRATLSLSLYLQMVGRGGRSSNKIFKDSFIFIDGGDNIATFGEWSSERDWEDIFWNGIGKPKPKKVDIEDVQECDNCGFLMPKNSLVCDGCGFEKEPAQPAPKKEVVLSDSVLQPIKKIPPPNGKKIVQYTLSKNENAHFAFRILQNKILDMFIYYRVTIGQYEKAKNNGKLDEKIKKFVQQCYFSIINEPKFKDDSNRTMAYVINKCKEKIERYYYGSK